MEFIAAELATYIGNHTKPESELLRELNRETYAKIMMPRMLSGHLQGRFLSLLSYMIRPTHILEIGTYTGYSAICLAEGLQPDGKLITIDINEELEDMVRGYFRRANVDTKIELMIGDAIKLIPTLNGLFDLVFIDADKENYLNYYNLVFEKVRAGGYIIADNVLWSGKVLEVKKDKDTRAIDEFNKAVQHDERVENMVLPLRDGLMLIRKK